MALNKLERLRLKRDLYGLSLDQCPDHKLPLMRHEDNFWKDYPDKEPEWEGCWDCPFVNENGEQCAYHVHEYNQPWLGIDFGEEPNEVQLRREDEDAKYFWPKSGKFITQNQVILQGK